MNAPSVTGFKKKHLENWEKELYRFEKSFVDVSIGLWNIFEWLLFLNEKIWLKYATLCSSEIEAPFEAVRERD